MKKLNEIFFALIILMFSSIIISCNNQDLEVSKDVQSSKIFQDVELYTDLGESHNTELDRWFSENKDKLSEKDLNARFSLVDEYFKTNFDRSTYGVKYRLFNIQNKSKTNNRISTADLEFDPFSYLENNKENIRPLTYEFLERFFTQTAELESFEEEVKFIDDLENEIINNDELSESDKNGIRNLLIVYKSSYSYWKENLGEWMIAMNPSQNVRSLPIEEDEYQKIAWADIVEGTAGGLIGGPAGALVGLAAGSITMAIGVS